MYLNWKKLTINNFSESNINSLYHEGYLFTREHLGSMYQTRSLRIDLSKFELSSENKRILRKVENLKLQVSELPYDKYDWTIGKLGKDFYTTKFGDGTFSANKTKELLTTKHNFNKLFVYKVISNSEPVTSDNVGYAICFESNELLHYSYPFYDLQAKSYKLIPNIGIGMMTQAILWAKANNKKYIYLGSIKDQVAKYKLQFSGLEWFDGQTWQTDLEELKNILK